MKQLSWTLLGLLHFVFPPPLTTAQDLSGLIPAAHYTLINTDEDSLGFQERIELEHAPFSGSNGVYSNGLYISNNPDDGSYIHSPFMAALYDSVFAVQLEFQFAGLDAMIRPVLVCGEAYRYLGLLTWPDSTFYVLYNNGNYIPLVGLHATEDQWYEVTLIHHLSTALTEFYLDGIKVYELNVPLDRNMNDGVISNTNFSMGRTFKGYWRNLRIYGTEDISSTQDFGSEKDQLFLFPNPARSSLQFTTSIPNVTHWSITGIDGAVMMKGKVSEANHEIDIHALMPGGYIFLVQTSTGMILAQKTFVKN